MTSLLSRLQKLNKEGTPPPWWISHHPDNVEHFIEPEVATVEDELKDADAELIVECRNSLPAVLNLIEAAQELEAWLADCSGHLQERLPKDTWVQLARRASATEAALAVFVSGQEEPT